jgi:hypothetical protein
MPNIKPIKRYIIILNLLLFSESRTVPKIGKIVNITMKSDIRLLLVKIFLYTLFPINIKSDDISATATILIKTKIIIT